LRRIVILGGGVTGLALAYRRNQNPAPGDDILVLEEGPQPGGSVRTLREDGFVLEAGPHTLRTTPAAERLLADLGLSGEVLVADPGAPRWVLRDGRARALRPGPAALFSSALPLGARLRALREPFVPRRPAALRDETVHDFFARRFGPDFALRVADPFATGVWADDPRTLSMRSAFPALWDAEERTGSVLKGLAGRPDAAGPRARSRTITFRDGLASLAERLVETSQRAGVRVELNAEVLAIEGPFDEGTADAAWRIQIADGTVYPADALVCALDARSLTTLLGARLPRSGDRLSALEYSRLSVVLQAFRPERASDAPRGFGVLAPRGEGLQALGILYPSAIFPNRAPDGVALTTSVFGGALDPSSADRSESDLLGLAEAEVRRLHPRVGPRIHGRVLRWAAALPRLPLGHHATLELLERDVAEINAGGGRPRLAVTGSWRDGLGLGRRIARAEELAPTL
jgi:oxygen-dependent protoporphyrinogen oxidase